MKPSSLSMISWNPLQERGCRDLHATKTEQIGMERHKERDRKLIMEALEAAGLDSIRWSDGVEIHLIGVGNTNRLVVTNGTEEWN